MLLYAMADTSDANTSGTGSRTGNEAFYVAHTELLEMVAEAKPNQEIFSKTARLIESISPLRTWCTLKIVEGPDLNLRLAAAPSLPTSLTENLERLKVSPDDGTCRQAVLQRTTVVSEDIASDPTNEAYREIAIRFGIKSCWSVPVLNLSGTPVAVITSFYHLTYNPDPTMLRRVGAMCDLVRLAIERQQASEELIRSEEKFRSAAAATNDAIWDWDIVNATLWWNDGFSKLFGFEGKGNGPTLQAWSQRIHREDRQRIMESLRGASAGHLKHWKGHYRFRKSDGEMAYVLDQAEITFDSTGKAIRMIGGMSDVTYQHKAEHDLKVLNRALEMLRSCNRRLIRATDESQLLADICSIAKEVGGYEMAWVGFTGSGPGKPIIPVAHIGDRKSYLSSIRLSYSADDPTGNGPAGRTVRTGKAVICEDIRNEESGFYWKEEALVRGFRSLVCLPLKDGEKCFGFLSLLSNTVNAIGADEQTLLQELADNLAFGITSLRSRDAQKTTQDTIVKVAKAVSDGFGTQFYQLLAKNVVEALGASAVIIGRIDRRTNSVSTLSYVLNGILQENISYSLKDTPFERIPSKEACIFDSNLHKLFPKDHYIMGLGIEAYAGIALYDSEEEPAGILSVLFTEPIRDASLVRSILQIFAERVASEMARQAADTRIFEQASLLDKARDAISTRGLDHNITYWNKSAERLYGFASDEAVSRSARELLYDDSSEYMAAYESTLKDGEWVGELRQIDKYGKHLVVESRWSLFRDSKGKPNAILTISTDITEQKSLEQQLLRSQRLESIGTLAGGFAHDINNVLAPISMSIELLRGSVQGDRGGELLDTIALSSRRAADMVGQILSFARGVKGKRIAVSTSGIIEGLGGIIRDTFPKSIRFEARSAPELWPVTGDPTQIHQVLLNLCLNARDAMPDGGELSVTAANECPAIPGSNPGPYVRIEVRDTGHGIPADILERIFDPFFTTKDIGKGTGLGLSTSLAIVKSHGGLIQSQSEVGKSTCFTVYLPALPQAPVQDAPQETPRPLPTGNGETVLVIDDEPAILDMTVSILERFGYVPLAANSGVRGLEIYRENFTRISAVITDMMMPGIDGSGTIRGLLLVNPGARIIAVSGVGTNGKIAKSFGPGVRHFLQKPYTAEAILLALDNTIGKAPL